jgi:hypothetical protein
VWRMETFNGQVVSSNQMVSCPFELLYFTIDSGLRGVMVVCGLSYPLSPDRALTAATVRSTG